MKINSDELKTHYQAYVDSRKPNSRDGCPSGKKLLGLLRSRLSEKEGTRIVDHISACSYCAREFKFMAEILRNEAELLQDIGQFLPRKISDEDQNKAKELFPGSRKIRRLAFSHLSWKTAVLVSCFVIIGAIISVLLMLPSREEFRTDYLLKVELFQPVGESIYKSPLVFKWKKVRNSEYYVLELFDKALLPIWKSEKISTNYVVLPSKIFEKLEIGSSFFWVITAHFSNGEKARSRLEEFSLKE